MTTLRSGLRACWTNCEGGRPDQFAQHAFRKAHALAGNVGAGVLPDRDGFRIVAELKADLGQQPVGIGLDHLGALVAENVVDRQVAGNVGQGARRLRSAPFFRPGRPSAPRRARFLFTHPAASPSLSPHGLFRGVPPDRATGNALFRATLRPRSVALRRESGVGFSKSVMARGAAGAGSGRRKASGYRARQPSVELSQSSRFMTTETSGYLKSSLSSELAASMIAAVIRPTSPAPEPLW